MKKNHQLFSLSVIDKTSLNMARVALVALIFMMVLVTIEVLIRKFLGVSTKIAHDFAGYSLVALIFFGAAGTLRVGKHLRVTIVYDRFGSRTKAIVEKASYLVGITFITLLFWASITLVINSYEKGSLTESVVQIPEFIPELFIPVGLFFFLLQLLVQFFREFKG